MPALADVPGVIRVAMRQVQEADIDVLNILHFSFTGSDSIGDLELFATGLQVAWDANIRSGQTPTIHLADVTCQDLTSPTSPVAVIDAPGTPGALVEPALPAEVAMVVRHKILRRYRGGHPRSYIAGLAQTWQADTHTWSNTAITDMGAWFDTFRTTAIATYGALVITNMVNVSYYEGFTNVIPVGGRARVVPNRRTPPLVDVVTATTINPRPSTQRRRSLQSS